MGQSKRLIAKNFMNLKGDPNYLVPNHKGPDQFGVGFFVQTKGEA
jgi:hypothetical protein